MECAALFISPTAPAQFLIRALLKTGWELVVCKGGACVPTIVCDILALGLGGSGRECWCGVEKWQIAKTRSVRRLRRL